MSDRGMMKWNAFNALLAHGSNVNKMILNRKRVEKPVLSSDQIEEININLQVALEDSREVEIAFYDKGFILLAEGVIEKVDVNTKTLKLPDLTIRFSDILGIEFKE